MEGIPGEGSRGKQRCVVANCRDSSDQACINNRDLFSMKLACLEVFRVSPGFAIHVPRGVGSYCPVQMQVEDEDRVKDAA